MSWFAFFIGCSVGVLLGMFIVAVFAGVEKDG